MGLTTSLYQVILSTAHGQVYELDIQAPDAHTAAWIAGTEVTEQQPELVVTNVHARRVVDSIYCSLRDSREAGPATPRPAPKNFGAGRFSCVHVRVDQVIQTAVLPYRGTHDRSAY